MYTVTAIKHFKRSSSEFTTSKTIYNDVFMSDNVKAVSPKLDLTENAAGTFSIKIAPTNDGYDIIEKLTTEIQVFNNVKNELLWRGRVISIKEDFNKNKTLTCEGALAFLNDSVQPQELYSAQTVYSFLNAVIGVHNQQVDDYSYKKFELGTVDSAFNTITFDEIYTNYETTLKVISDKIVSIYGGYITITTSSTTGANVLNYYSETNRTSCVQTVSFGKNLLDFTNSYDATDFCTAILPLGASISNTYGISSSGIEGVSAYTTIASVNGGNIYYSNADAVAEYGWICKKVNWDKEENPELLLEKAQEYLSSIQFDKMTLDCKAIDLGLVDHNMDNILLNKTIRVLSVPHGLDKVFPVKKVSIPLDNPSNTTYTLTVNATNLNGGISAKASENGQIVDYKLQDINYDILLRERQNQADLISSFTTGYITITQRENGSNELYVTDQKIPKDYNADDDIDVNPGDVTPSVRKYWRWNLNGLEYVNKDYNASKGWRSDLPRVAITMDGSISADFITTGTLNANIIRAGVLKNTYWDNGKKVFYLDLENGILYMNATTLTIGGASLATSSELSAASTKFENELAAAASTADANARSYASTAESNAITTSKAYGDTQLAALTGSEIYKRLADANQGIYASSGKYYIKADWIMSGTMVADRILGGTLHLGGYNSTTGSLYLHDSSGNTIYTLNTDGLSSYSRNYNSGTYYVTKYAKNGNLNDGQAGGNSTNYYANIIGYYRAYSNGNLIDSIPFAYIGIKGLSGSNRYQQLQIYNNQDNVSIYSSNILYLTGANRVSMYTNTGSHINLEGDNGNKIDIYASGNDYNGHMVIENNRLYLDGGGLGEPFVIDKNKIKISKRLVVTQGLYTKDSGGSNIIDLAEQAYNKANEVSNNMNNDFYNGAIGHVGSITYKGSDDDWHGLSFNGRGQITKSW